MRAGLEIVASIAIGFFLLIVLGAGMSKLGFSPGAMAAVVIGLLGVAYYVSEKRN